ncbi:MAG: class A beta-lactamase-related serine hydrolase [Acidobacteriales bacterium]|nr:MAG: class A beta-lactamase-related serine hydrolase [Terriglobales bacterium]
MRIALLFLLLCPLVVEAASNFGADKTDPQAAGMNAARLAQIPIRMREYVDAGKTAGVVTLVVRHGRIASFEAVGYQDLETKTPMRTDSFFRIMSMTKPVTCAGVMILVDEGRVALLDPVEKYLPEFKGLKVNPCGARGGSDCAPAAPSRPVTIQDLMTHASGLPSMAPREGLPAAETLAESVAGVSRVTLLFEPGTGWYYSQVGYEALGRVIEVVTKQPFEQFMAERVLRPIGMKDSFFFLPSGLENRLAATYTYEPDGLKRARSAPRKYPTPQGGLFSTALDMARFHQMMLNKGTLDGRRVLSAAAVETMTTSYTGELRVGFAPGVGHGFGFEVVREASGVLRYNSIGSFLKGGAYRTYGWVDPAKDLAGIIMMQRTNGGGDIADEFNSVMAIAAGAIER